MKKVCNPIESCNECLYSVLQTFPLSSRTALFCEKTSRVLLEEEAVPYMSLVSIPDDCPLPDYVEPNPE